MLFRDSYQRPLEVELHPRISPEEQRQIQGRYELGSGFHSKGLGFNRNDFLPRDEQFESSLNGDSFLDDRFEPWPSVFDNSSLNDNPNLFAIDRDAEAGDTSDKPYLPEDKKLKSMNRLPKKLNKDKGKDFLAPGPSRRKSRAGRKPLSGVFGICRQDCRWVVSYKDDYQAIRHRYFFFQSETEQIQQLILAKRFLWKVVRLGRKVNPRDGEGLEEFVRRYESDGNSEFLGVERASPSWSGRETNVPPLPSENTLPNLLIPATPSITRKRSVVDMRSEEMLKSQVRPKRFRDGSDIEQWDIKGRRHAIAAKAAHLRLVHSAAAFESLHEKSSSDLDEALNPTIGSKQAEESELKTHSSEAENNESSSQQPLTMVEGGCGSYLTSPDDRWRGTPNTDISQVKESSHCQGKSSASSPAWHEIGNNGFEPFDSSIMGLSAMPSEYSDQSTNLQYYDNASKLPFGSNMNDMPCGSTNSNVLFPFQPFPHSYPPSECANFSPGQPLNYVSLNCPNPVTEFPIQALPPPHHTGNLIRPREGEAGSQTTSLVKSDNLNILKCIEEQKPQISACYRRVRRKINDGQYKTFIRFIRDYKIRKITALEGSYTKPLPDGPSKFMHPTFSSIFPEQLPLGANRFRPSEISFESINPLHSETPFSSHQGMLPCPSSTLRPFQNPITLE